MPGRKHLRGVGGKEQCEYDIKETSERSGLWQQSKRSYSPHGHETAQGKGSQRGEMISEFR